MPVVPRRGSNAFHKQEVSTESAVSREAALSKALVDADALYASVAKMCSSSSFNTMSEGKLPKRSPYTEGEKMGRGALFAKRFRTFVEAGGVAAHKNCVAVSIRLNDIRDIESANGNGTFKVSFFLDTAFWVPWWDKEHFEHTSTVGTFSKFEPELAFPEVDVEAGMLRWGLRTAEFGAKARKHEVQLGQNYETELNSAKNAMMAMLMRKNNSASKNMVTVADAGSHWPRLWRVCVNDDELEALEKLDRKERKKLEPSDETPKAVPPRLRDLFTALDEQREKNLPNPNEGIGFVSYEVHCTHRNEFNLHEFPFDMHLLRIIVRIDKKDGDPMSRTIVPVAHDLAFFVSSRVQKMTDYHLAKCLDWDVVKEPASYGGNQRINASAIVRRKPGYFVRNYVVIVFLLTSSSFTAFLSRPDDFNTRVAIIFTVLLAVVAFKYNSSDMMPRVSYATILDSYILLNFYIVLAVAVASFVFSMQCTMGGIMSGDRRRVVVDTSCSKMPGHWYGMSWLPVYDPVVETCVALFAMGLWLGANAWYWQGVWKRIQYNLRVVEKIGIGWMSYKSLDTSKVKGRFDAERFIQRKGDKKDAGRHGRSEAMPPPPRHMTEDQAARSIQKAFQKRRASLGSV